MGRVAWSSFCSRNAHDQNVLVRRAQGRTVWPRETGWMGETSGTGEDSRSEVFGTLNPELRSANVTSRLSRMSRVSRATVGVAEVADDESRVGDWVCREGGCVLTGYRGAQSLGSMSSSRPPVCGTVRAASPTSPRWLGWKATSSSPRTCSSTQGHRAIHFGESPKQLRPQH